MKVIIGIRNITALLQHAIYKRQFCIIHGKYLRIHTPLYIYYIEI